MRIAGFLLICAAVGSPARADAPKPRRVEPFAPKLLAGPFASPADACLDYNRRNGVDSSQPWDGYEHTCQNLDKVLFKKRSALSAPYLDVAMFQLVDRTSLEIAIRTKAGWFLYELPGKGSRGTAHCGGTLFSATVTSVKRAVPELRIAYTSQGSCFHRDRDWDWVESGVIVVGVGPGGTPSATPGIVLDLVEHASDKRVTQRAKLTPTWNRDGSLDLTGSVTHPNQGQRRLDPAEDLIAEDLLGHHVLAFP